MEKITVRCYSEMGGELLGVWYCNTILFAAKKAQVLRGRGYYVTVKIEAGPVEYMIWG